MHLWPQVCGQIETMLGICRYLLVACYLANTHSVKILILKTYVWEDPEAQTPKQLFTNATIKTFRLKI